MVAQSLGGGGGSIARVEDGELKVGPQSAGAYPGPMCYGLGGESPTVTDANLILGLLNPTTFLGGRRSLDADKARAGIKEHVADPLGISVEEAAWQVRSTVDRIIADGLTAYADSRGLSPDTLFAYGGGGPNHVSAVADLVDIPIAYCFPMSPVFSAYGSSRMDVSHLYEVPVLAPADGGAVDVDSLADGMKEEAKRDMLGEGFDPSSIDYELEAGVSLLEQPTAKIFLSLNGGGAVEAGEVAGTARAAFEKAGVADAKDVVWESVRLRASAATPHPELPSRKTKGDPKPREAGETRQVWTGEGYEDVATFDLVDLAGGDVIAGPAVIDAEFTTIPVSSGRDARIDGAGNVILETRGSK
jgi:N-methylhydantoinase A/acetophenone carboxylase